MYQKLTMALMMLLLPAFVQTTGAQSDESHAAEAIEKMAESFQEKADHMAEAIESAMQENSAELEEWADRYSGQWEEWAEGFEKNFSRWAEEQEELWEEWAEEYSERWEDWAEQLEGNQLEGKDLDRLIKRNLEMLGEMPLGQMVDGLMKEGAEGFESAPWDSLGDLQNLLQDAVKKSVDEVERRMAAQQDEIAGMAEQLSREAQRNRAEQEVDLEYILPVIENQQQGLKAKRKILDNEARNALKKIEGILRSESVDASDLKRQLKKIIDSSKDRDKANGEDVQRRVREELERSVRKRMDQDRRRMDQDRRRMEQNRRRMEQRRKRAEQDRTRVEQAYQQALETAKKQEKKRSSDAAKAKLKKTLESIDGDGKSVAEIYNALQAEEKKLLKKNDELEQLKQEIKKLRKEVEKMKSGK